MIMFAFLAASEKQLVLSSKRACSERVSPVFRPLAQSLSFYALPVHHQSDPSSTFYIILRGKVEVKIANGSLLKAVNVLGRGEYL
jgi:hypothetical protein